jgi:hypothetical protein
VTRASSGRTGGPDGSTGRQDLLESIVVVVLAVASTVLVVGLPVIASAVFPYGSFSFGQGAEILRIGAPFLLLFAVAVLLGRSAGADERGD